MHGDAVCLFANFLYRYSNIHVGLQYIYSLETTLQLFLHSVREKSNLLYTFS